MESFRLALCIRANLFIAGPALAAVYVLPPEMDGAILQERVQRFLRLFRAPERRESFGRGLSRSGRYLDMIQRIFKNHDLPRELAYVAMIESEFNHTAVSRPQSRRAGRPRPPANEAGLTMKDPGTPWKVGSESTGHQQREGGTSS